MLKDLSFVALGAFIISGIVIWKGDMWVEAFLEGYLITLFIFALATEIYDLPASMGKACMAVGASCIGAATGATGFMNLLN